MRRSDAGCTASALGRLWKCRPASHSSTNPTKFLPPTDIGRSLVQAAFQFGAPDTYRFRADIGALRDWLVVLPFLLTIIAVAWAGEKTGPAEKARGV